MEFASAELRTTAFTAFNWLMQYTMLQRRFIFDDKSTYAVVFTFHLIVRQLIMLSVAQTALAYLLIL